jgi:uncharacterized protein
VTRGATGRPLLVPVLSLLRHPGSRSPIRVEAVLGELRVGDAFVPDGRAVTVDVTAEAINDAVTVTGEVRAPYRAECRRCLEPLEAELVSEVQEIFERRPVDGETYPLDGEVIDLEPLAREAVLLGLPLAPLCREDCAGPAPERFPAAPESSAPAPDPRWAALRDLELG